MKPSVGIPLMILSSVMFAGMSACFKGALPTASVWQAIFFRTAASLPLLLLLFPRRPFPVRAWSSRSLFLRSLAGFTALSLSVYAISVIPLGNAAILFSTAPLFVALLAPRLVQESVPRATFLLLPPFFVGVGLIVKPAASFQWVPSLAALTAGFMSALTQLQVRQLSRTERTITIVLYFTALSAVGAAPPALLFWRPLTPEAAGLLVLSAVFATAGQLAMTKAFALEAASRISLYSYFYPLAAYLFGVLFFGEAPGLASGIGAAIIIGCGAWASRVFRPASPPGTPGAAACPPG